MATRILRLPIVLSQNGYSRSTHYAYIQQGLFTKPVKLGVRAVGWPESEVIAIIEARIAGKSDQEIRQLVVKLGAARKAMA